MAFFCYNCRQKCLYNEQLDKISIQLDILINNIEEIHKPPEAQEIIVPPNSPAIESIPMSTHSNENSFERIPLPPPLPPPVLTSPSKDETTEEHFNNNLLSSLQIEINKRKSL